MSTPDERAVANFRRYIQIKSVHPNVNYDECKVFLTNLLTDVGLPFKVHELVVGKPIIVATWEGTNPTLTSILLNSHMDVVPVFDDLWTHDPFGAEMDTQGNIYGRGTQDMKSVTIQHLEAVWRLKSAGARLKRTVHLSFVPDEEIGGEDGMKAFSKSNEFKALNVGFAFDEGTASEDAIYRVYYAERTIWHTQFSVNGTDGHGSLLLPNTPGEKLRKLVDRLDDFRQTQVDKLNANPNLTVGDVTTVNLTIIQGGVQENVIPPQLILFYDMRIAIDQDLEEFERRLNTWASEAGDDITISFTQKDVYVGPTAVDGTNPYWVSLKQLFDEQGYTLKTSIMNGGTDGRYVRQTGIPVLGFSPIINTPVLMHANDEFLNKDVFLKGIQVFEKLIPQIANT